LQIEIPAGAEHESGKFSASSLEIDGYNVRARMVINDLSELDAMDFVYSLRVENEVGVQEYPFELEVQDFASYQNGAVVSDQTGGSGGNVENDGRDDGKEVKEGGVGVGSIVGIVVVVVLIAALALFIFWAKSRNRCCFAGRAGGANQPPKAKKEKKKGKKGAADAEAGTTEPLRDPASDLDRPSG